MLIATLPTLVSEADLHLAEKIFSHPLVSAARYNTGGDSPLAPGQIIARLAAIAKMSRKDLWVDLEGRQLRVAEWTPFERGSVVLNQDFDIELPGKIFFRRAGWCKITGVNAAKGKIYFEPMVPRTNYFLGKSQSVHVVAKAFELKGYVGGSDTLYIEAAARAGLNKFMLSFVEKEADIAEAKRIMANVGLADVDLIAKIESVKGLACARNFKIKLMAARDDLWLSFVNNRQDFLGALRQIISIDHGAIVASRLLSGLENGGEVSMGDVADVELMKRYGYKNFMFSDELSRNFEAAMQAWQTIF